MKHSFSLTAVFGFALYVCSAHAADVKSIVVDASVLEVKTSLGQNNAYRVILGKLNNSPVCLIEKWGYEGKRITWQRKSVLGSASLFREEMQSELTPHYPFLNSTMESKVLNSKSRNIMAVILSPESFASLIRTRPLR